MTKPTIRHATREDSDQPVHSRSLIRVFADHMLLSFHVQLPTHIRHEQKVHGISYESVNLFSMKSVFAQSFEHLNKVHVGVKATMESKLEEG